MKRFHIIITGKVQGVFYRVHAKEKATELGLKGYVKNLNDGTVKIVVEGFEDKLKELIDFCKTSPGNSKVDSINIKEKEPTNEFKDFEIRY